MAESTHRRTRVISVIAATAISLACGTNYAYSAWSPEFASHMKLSSTQSNLIGTVGNLGMYIAGVPVGMMVDSQGPRPGVWAGGLLLGLGYLILQRAYASGPGSIGLPWLCFSTFLTGVGGASAFAGSVKTSALNWPNHRGTATAFPLSAFGLGAFFFTTISFIAFPDDTSNYLILSSAGTFGLCYCSVFFLRVVPDQSSYSAVPTRDRRESNLLNRTKSTDSYHGSKRQSGEPGTLSNPAQASPAHNGSSTTDLKDSDETSSLISKSSSSPGDIPSRDKNSKPSDDNSRHLDIRNIAMLRYVEFYQLWLLLGLLTGVGLMTINNIGNNARALWNHYDDSASSTFIQERQLMHVSILSFMSFSGRLLSGVGSDIIVRKLHASRFWCLFISSCLFCVSQICGVRIENPHFLGLLSGLTGLAYGILFGVCPALVAECFGVGGLSQNWGCMTLAPILFGNIFNLSYGHIFDSHSTILPDGQRQCPDGRYCYNNAYWMTFGGSVIGVILSLWSIRHDHVKKLRARKAFRDPGREA